MSTKQQPTPGNTIKDPDQWVSGDDPMTGAQASYLETLAEQTHHDAPDEKISKAEASKLIDEMKGELNDSRPAPPTKRASN